MMSGEDEEEREAHFLLIHGSCHGAWCWYKVATLLRAAGHRVTALDMAAAGVDPRSLDQIHSMSDYLQPLTEFLESLPPEERVVLVGHSNGGIAITIAMEMFPQKIAVAVFVTAYMPSLRLDMPTIIKEYNKTVDSEMDNQYTFDDGPDNPPTSLLIGPKFMSSQMYQLCPPEDLTLGTLLVRPERLFSGAVLLKATAVTEQRYGRVHRVFVACEEDNDLKEEFRKWMVENNPPDEVKVIYGSDHMVMLSKPVELSSCLQEIAKKYS